MRSSRRTDAGVLIRRNAETRNVGFIERQRDISLALIDAFLLVDPHPRQSFVQQSLNAFIKMLGLLPVRNQEDTTDP